MIRSVTLILLLASTLATYAQNDVVMTINGKKIYRDEFEYIYHKNQQQQVEQETMQQYVDRFINFKLKVFEAEACGIDTTETFKKEFEEYQTVISNMDDTQKKFLIKEYRDGILLFEICNEKIWNLKDITDDKLLEYFKKNSKKNHWSSDLLETNKSLVIQSYQEDLEKTWIKSLRKKYKVKLNKNLIREIK